MTARRKDNSVSNRCKGPEPARAVIRCAIYTRKSSDEGLQQEFNSLDAQREAGEAYVASQKAEGWITLADRYDDGGYTGGNMERPALARLLADIDAGKIDCVVVYKVDRLSRSLMDFARIMETFDRHTVSFVSVTQHFNTTHSMGRLTLNILLSFAQFEREIIGERIRDKIAASRAKGKWTGGMPILGYDVDRSGGSPRLVVNPAEASQVRQIFDLYLKHGTLLATVEELERRNWRTKAWMTSNGKSRGGQAWDKCRLHSLLNNVLYIGRVMHKSVAYPGEHEPVISNSAFEQVRALMLRNRNGTAPETRNKYGALLRGLLHCKACGKAMVHVFSNRGSKRYRYYTCMNAIKLGIRKCKSGSLPAGEIEHAVVDQIRCIGQDKGLQGETLKQTQSQSQTQVDLLVDEQAQVKRAMTRLQSDLRRAVSQTATPSSATLAVKLTEQIRDATNRIEEVERRIAELNRNVLTAVEVAEALTRFDPVWTSLSPRDQVRLINLVVSRVDFDIHDSSIEVSFHAAGIEALANQCGAAPPVDPSSEPQPKTKRRSSSGREVAA